MYMHTIRSKNGELWLVNSPFTPRKTGSCVVSEKYNRDQLKFPFGIYPLRPSAPENISLDNYADYGD